MRTELVFSPSELLQLLYWKLKYLVSSDSTEYTIGGESVAFITSSYTEFMRFIDLVGEEPVVEDLINSMNRTDVFYDIGANVGTYTCFAASKSPKGSVIAFEPEPDNATRLRENLTLNHLDAQVFEVALSDRTGTVDLELTGDQAGEGEHTIVASGADSDSIEVPTMRGDDIIKKRSLPAPNIIKIDVEGAEFLVLQGLAKTIEESCRLIYVEVHPTKMLSGSEDQIVSFLEKRGFEIEYINQRGDEQFLRASK
ncbi:FkbM family methyltransferase [Halorubellus sp. JP-L1]|uniref:FkbM family methyltransferase n=1 Tax=Halorubellus sp. JP-L1 TaxID=2715753 RepID=UPI0014085B26|nr:FkbM family methyltransferase [Halorubellus sp. JP-L1]NHN40957.1 FkbM family methyltransferase [Halorubellus sp. JP-L1]